MKKNPIALVAGILGLALGLIVGKTIPTSRETAASAGSPSVLASKNSTSEQPGGAPNVTDARKRLLSLLTLDPSLDEAVMRIVRSDGLDQTLLEVAMGSAQRSLYMEIFEYLALERPEEAIALLADLTDVGCRDISLARAGNGLARKDPAAAIEWLKQLSRKDFEQAFRDTLEPIGRADPKIAAEILAAETDPQLRKEGISDLAYSWAQKSPEEAFAWMDSLSKNPSEYELAYEVVASEYARTKPVEMVQLLKDLGPSEMKSNIALCIGSTLSEKDLGGCIQFTKTINDTGVQAGILQGVAIKLDQNFADGGYSRAFMNVPPDMAFQMLDVVTPFIDTKFAEAANAITHLPEDKVDFFMSRVMPAWAGKDASAAVGWANALPDGPLKQAAFASIDLQR